MKPKLFLTSNLTITIAEGDPVELFAEIHGDPQPMHYWSMPSEANDMVKVNQIISENLGLVRQINKLTKASTERTDAGIYRYYANNTYDHVTFESVLIVQCKLILSSIHIGRVKKCFVCFVT